MPLTRTVLTARRYGDASALEYAELEMPPLPPDHVLVSNRASGINPLDVRRLTGEIRFTPLPLTFGGEFAGVITAVGSAVKDWAVGDEVLGSHSFNSHATVLMVPAAKLVRKPAGMPWEVAATLPAAGQTATTLMQAIGGARTLLIHGASGGVGSVLVQLAVQQGIDVVATASPANHAYLKELGAEPLAYGEGLVERARGLRPQGFDAQIDMAGAVGTPEADLLALAGADGFIGSIVGRPIQSPRIQALVVQLDTRALQAIVDAVSEGTLRWTVSHTYPFGEARRGFADMLSQHTRGKTALLFA